MTIVTIGHNTKLFNDSYTRYAELPDCCQYESVVNGKTNSHASMELQGLIKNHGSMTEYVRDKNPTSGSCCDKQ